jgi:hypothetical protein
MVQPRGAATILPLKLPLETRKTLSYDWEKGL